MDRKRDAQQLVRDKAVRDISRARTPLFHRGCHGVTRDTSNRDVTSDRDSDTPGLEGRGVTITLASAAFEARTAAHKAKLAADPRFAGWLGLMTQDDPPPDLAAIARQEERTELMRRAKYAFLCWAQDNPAADPFDVQAARDFLAAHPPLARPLGTGEPSTTHPTDDRATTARETPSPGALEQA